MRQEEMPKRIIVDCDNTMGVPGCDLDDALALLFLLGCSDKADVCAVTTAYGNSTAGTVWANTRRLLAEWGLALPMYRGCADARHLTCDAARFLAETALAEPGEISVLVLGSTTNLRAAYALNPGFWGNLREVAAMGGITQTLVFNGTIMDELNFSCDPIATRLMLSLAPHITVATANNCLAAFFSADELWRRFAHARPGSIGDGIWRACELWLTDMRDRYGLNGFHCWDVVAAAYLIAPELFENEVHNVTLSEALLGAGFLEESSGQVPSARVNMPRICDAACFTDTVMTAWERGIARLEAAERA